MPEVTRITILSIYSLVIFNSDFIICKGEDSHKIVIPLIM